MRPLLFVEETSLLFVILFRCYDLLTVVFSVLFGGAEETSGGKLGPVIKVITKVRTAMNNEKTSIFAEKRCAKRIPAPTGTTALLKNGKSPVDAVYVHDISVAGMLICGNQIKKKYPIDSSVKEIIIDVPSDGINTDGRVCLVINNARVVRSCFDQASQTLCYGISFMHESFYTKEKIERVVKEIERQEALRTD